MYHKFVLSWAKFVPHGIRGAVGGSFTAQSPSSCAQSGLIHSLSGSLYFSFLPCSCAKRPPLFLFYFSLRLRLHLHPLLLFRPLPFFAVPKIRNAPAKMERRRSDPFIASSHLAFALSTLLFSHFSIRPLPTNHPPAAPPPKPITNAKCVCITHNPKSNFCLLLLIRISMMMAMIAAVVEEVETLFLLLLFSPRRPWSSQSLIFKKALPPPIYPPPQGVGERESEVILRINITAGREGM